jgi:quinolinate synthase
MLKDYSSLKSVTEEMMQKLSSILPEVEIKLKAELVYEICKLKKEKDAYILGHNYMEPALYHTITDYVGDSLELARISASIKHSRVVFCGVHFMAETTKVLAPQKHVLIPSDKAGCSLAGSIEAQDVRDLKSLLPSVPVVTYINTYADVKAETDVCCTSGNASKIVTALDLPVIIFIPDEFLAKNVANETNREVVSAKDPNLLQILNNRNDKKFLVYWPGTCYVHEQFTVEDIKNARRQYPEITVLAHPECPPEVVKNSDFSGSTSKMIQFTKVNKAKRLMLLTECSMADNIIAEQPESDIIRMCSIRCKYMNQITLEDTLNCLKSDRYEVSVPAHIIDKARLSIEKMLELSK